MKVKQVGDVVPSPGGNMVAWTETRAVMEAEKSEMNTQVMLARADGAGRLQLTYGEKSANSPAFSPDGRFVYFASERPGERLFSVLRRCADGAGVSRESSESVAHVARKVFRFD